MNVLHAPVNVGSQASSLATAENQARLEGGCAGRSWSADFRHTPIVSAADHVSRAGKIFRGVSASKYAAPLRSFFYGLRNARKFDVLHLYFGRTMLLAGSLFPGWGQVDLPLWKAMKKRLFMTFQGCDARLRSVCAHESASACASGVCQVIGCDELRDQKKRCATAILSKYCEKIFCLNPDLLQFVPGAEFLPYVNLGGSLLEPVEKSQSARPVIVHAPTDRAIKGTSFVEKASAELQATHAHQLVLIENVPRREALRIYRTAHVVVDQLHVGWYGGFAVEGMALGLPVVAYLNLKHVQQIPGAMRNELPIVSATPETVAEVLAKLLDNAKWRSELGEQGRRFVERWHHPVKIARRMLQVYETPSISFWDEYRPDN
jgi:hypothetical protein